MTVKELIEYLEMIPQKNAKCIDGETGEDIHPTYNGIDKIVWF